MIKFKNVYLNDSFSLIGSTEHNPSVLKNVDIVNNDYYLDQKSIEECEIMYQKKVINGLLKKIKKTPEYIDLMIGTDLQNQLFASNFNASMFKIPFFGVYSACAGSVEAMIIASTFIDNKAINNSIVVVSSHNLVNEKQFRFPVEYGALKKKVNSFSSTGAVSILFSNKKSDIKVESATIGSVIDIGWKDTNDMGAAMAPAVAETLFKHFKESKRTPDYYDLIITGDLGYYGLKYMKDYINKQYNIKLENVIDTGVTLYNIDESSPSAGGSGPLCLPLVLLSELKLHKYNKILLVASGSLHSSVSSNLKKTMPAIAHAISMEVSPCI